MCGAVKDEMSAARKVRHDGNTSSSKKQDPNTENHPLKGINPRKEEECKKLGSEADPE